MKRKSFLRSLLIGAKKLFNKKNSKPDPNIVGSIDFFIPKDFEKLMDKYGDKNFIEERRKINRIS